MKLHPTILLHTFRDICSYFFRFTTTREKQFSDAGIIGQENLLWILAGYTTRELSTASIVQSLYRGKSHGDLTAPEILSIERPWQPRNIVRLIRKVGKNVRAHIAGARGSVIINPRARACVAKGYCSRSVGR